jgi:hypothetical protein
LKDALLVNACDNDVAQIDLVLRTYLSPNTNKGKYMAKLKKLITEKPIPNTNIQIMKEVRNKIANNNY